MYELILYEKRDRVVWLTLNQPERRNPLGGKAIEELVAALDDFRLDDESRVLIITGAGKAFCSGGDLKMMEKWQEGDGKRPAWSADQLSGSRWRNRACTCTGACFAGARP